MTPRGRIDDIEVLRGVAVVMAALFHIRLFLIKWEVPWWDHVTTYYFDFWPGVDLFFGISGFVIARTLMPSLREGLAAGQQARAALAFWVRRAWRILPSAWLWLAVILVQAALFNRSLAMDSFHTNFEGAVAAALSVANFRLAAGFMHFGSGATAHYWSLSLEEQFYVLLPLAVLFCGRFLVPLLILVFIGLMAAPQGVWIMQFRAQALVLVVLLAVAADQPWFAAFEPVGLGRSWLARWVVLGVPVACMAAVAPFRQRITIYPADVAGVLAVVPVFVACWDKDYIPTRGVLRRMLLWTGSRSYGLYLIHLPVYVGTQELWARLSPAGTVFGRGWGPTFVATAAVALVGLAELNFRVVEVPLRRHGARVANGIWMGVGDARPA
jgi:peptidoglycan/LPS O-acetylase OafA/YrhL